ncbi:MAG: arylsulfatase [Cyclobacteriaceae bacterium]
MILYKSPLIVFLGCLLLASCGQNKNKEQGQSQVQTQEQKQRPNIVLILADDLGYGCTGTYGAQPELLTTPAINRLAKEGRKFTRAYTPSSVCSPTRYGLLTGQYEWRTGRTNDVSHSDSPLTIETDRPTIASRLKEIGYSTAAIGKWHLGYQNDSTDYLKPLSPGPLDIGFDYHWGIPNNHGDIVGSWIENDRVVGLKSSQEDIPVNQRRPEKNWQGDDMLDIPAPFRVDTTVMNTLNQKLSTWIGDQSKDKPFFLYYAMPAIHVPMTPSRGFSGVSKAGVMGDWIMEMDASVDTVLQALHRHGFSENTLVVFTSDNGAHPSRAHDAVNAGLKLNGPFRGTKLTIWDGGFRVPYIVRWPGKVAAGSSSDELVNLVDIYASVTELLDIELATPNIEAPDSFSFLAAWMNGESKESRGPMVYTSYEGVVAIQHENWKFIEGKPGPPLRFTDKKRMKVEAQEMLFDLSTDIAEQNNLVNSNSEQVQKMKALLAELRQQGYSRKVF